MRYLGLDLGARSLGVAISDRTGVVASFYKSIKFDNSDKLFSELCMILEKEKIDKIVLGYPKNMDNSLGFRALETIEFKNKLEEVFDGEVILEDERLTTRLAENILINADMSRKKRKKVIDGVSAVVILQSYLDRKDR